MYSIANHNETRYYDVYNNWTDRAHRVLYFTYQDAVACIHDNGYDVHVINEDLRCDIATYHHALDCLQSEKERLEFARVLECKSEADVANLTRAMNECNYKIQAIENWLADNESIFRNFPANEPCYI